MLRWIWITLVMGMLGVSSARADELNLTQAKAKAPSLVKVLARKKFVKAKSPEVGVHLGSVTNDYFVRRYLLGLSAAYHVNDILALQITGTFSPDFGRGDWKAVTHEMFESGTPHPMVSKLIWSTAGGVELAPIHGKISAFKRVVHFDIYGQVGFGVAGTVDDLETMDCDGLEDTCQSTHKQLHPTLTVGGGVRVRPWEKVSLKVDVRTLSYIETGMATSLMMKNLMMVTGHVTVFWGT